MTSPKPSLTDALFLALLDGIDLLSDLENLVQMVLFEKFPLAAFAAALPLVLLPAPPPRLAR